MSRLVLAPALAGCLCLPPHAPAPCRPARAPAAAAGAAGGGAAAARAGGAARAWPLAGPPPSSTPASTPCRHAGPAQRRRAGRAGAQLSAPGGPCARWVGGWVTGCSAHLEAVGTAGCRRAARQRSSCEAGGWMSVGRRVRCPAVASDGFQHAGRPRRARPDPPPPRAPPAWPQGTAAGRRSCLPRTRPFTWMTSPMRVG